MSDNQPLEFRAPSPSEGELRKMDHAGQAHVLLTNFLEFRSVLMDHHVRLNKCQEVCKEWHGMALGWILGVIASVAATGLTYLAFLVGRHIFGG